MLDIALEHNVSALLLSQLNRDVEKDRGVRKPRLSDLKESGNLEQDAHTVLLNYAMPEPEDQPDKADAWMRYRALRCKPLCSTIGKQRNGPDGLDVELVLHGPSVRVEDFYAGTGNVSGALRQVGEWEREIGK
jgi:replicative DNA helicase